MARSRKTPSSRKAEQPSVASSAASPKAGEQAVEELLGRQMAKMIISHPAPHGMQPVVTEPFFLPDVSIEHVRRYLGHVQGSASALETVAAFHPKAAIRFAAQRALADVADIVLTKWPPAKAGYIRDPYSWLMREPQSGLKWRWEHELHRRKQPKPEDRDVLLSPVDQVRWHFVRGIWFHLSIRIIDVAVAVMYQLRGNAAEADRILNSAHAKEHHSQVDSLLVEFYSAVPEFSSGLKDQTVNPWFHVNALLVKHYEVFWKTVIEPLATGGDPSAWQRWRDEKMVGLHMGKKASWEVWSAWSAHSKSIKGLLLQWLRHQYPSYVSEPPSFVPFRYFGPSMISNSLPARSQK